MAQAAVVTAVLQRLADNFARCPIAGINLEGDTPADGSPFLAVEFPIAKEDQITIGSPGVNTYRESGAILFVLSIQRGTGVTQGNQWAGELAALFRGKQFSGVNTRAASSPVLDDRNGSGSYWRLTFPVNYYFDFQA